MSPLPPQQPAQQPQLLLSNRIYDLLKPVVTMVLPGLGTLYYAVALIWHLPKAEEIVGTVAALTTFLGLFMGVSTAAYNKSDSKYAGVLNVITPSDGSQQTLSVGLNQHPDVIQQMKAVTFQVNSNQ